MHFTESILNYLQTTPSSGDGHGRTRDPSSPAQGGYDQVSWVAAQVD